ncbi:Cytoplasmic thioredoxin isoenzyme 2 [Geranomyces michiganensis]|nr:Cytoplasmic thioredoxin isoenzyme 2 [Geranomyces michiganensis]
MVKVVKTAEEYAAVLKENKVVIDFHATWCGPCKMIAPKYEAFSTKYTGATFVKLDVDEVPDVAEKEGISSMPSFLIFVDGQRVGEIVGASPAKLELEIKKHVAASE